MNTNQFFSFNRCRLLLRNDLLINYKKYLLTILGAFVVGYVYMYMKMPKVHGEVVRDNVRVFMFGSSQYGSVFFTYILALGTFVGMAFLQLNNKVNTCNYLLMPASTFEKFIVQFLIRIVAGLGIFLILFWLDAHLARLSALSVFEGDPTLAIEPFNYLMLIINKKGLFETLLIPTVLFSIGIFLFSIRVFFKRFALVKTVITFAAISVIFVFILSLCSHIFYPTKYTTGVYVNYGEPYAPFNSIEFNNIQIWILLLFGLSPFFLLPLGYYKLKEKQV